MIKRDARLFLRSLVPAAVLTAVFAVLCAAAALAAVRGAESVYTPVKAAVVDSEDSVLSRMLIHGVAKTDYIDQLLDVVSCDMDEALAGLKSGELSAVIELPAGFLDAILTGEQGGGRILLSPAAAAQADVVAGVARFGELLLAAGQYGVFSGERLIWHYELDGQFYEDFLTQSNAALINEAMRADSAYFTMEVTHYADTAMSTEAYYGMSWLLLLLVLSTMFFSRLYTADRNRSMLCRLQGCGIGDGAFLLGKLIYPFLFQCVILAVSLGILSRQISMQVNLLTLGAALVCVAVATATGAAVMMCLERGAPAAAVIAVLGLFLCGGVVPRQMLPDGILLLGSITPFGASQGFLAPAFGGQLSGFSAAAGVAYLAACPALIFLRLRRLRVGGAEE